MIAKLDKITEIALKRGFFWPTAEIYGGKAGFYSYGHLGKSLKTKFENLWRKHFLKENCYEIESSAILPEQVFIASGHLEHFNDPLIECKTCHFRFRADQFIEDNLKKSAQNMTIEEMSNLIKKNELKCPSCGSWHLSEVRLFNMMFPISLGASITKDLAYLSGETAQAAYLSFKREFEATRKQLPLGIAIIGKVFRNEISPRQLFFRQREFTQAELQIFFDPDKLNYLEEEKWDEIKKYFLQLKQISRTASITKKIKSMKEKKEIIIEKKPLKEEETNYQEISCEEANKKLDLPKLYLYNMVLIQKFYLEKLRIPKEKFRFRELGERERAHYNKVHWDIELNLETLGGFKEVAGLHYRTDYDLSRHEKHSKQKMSIFWNNKTFIPHVLELSFGVDRNIWALLDLFYREEKERTLFSFPFDLAPIEIAVFPLVNRERLPQISEEVYNSLKKDFICFYDDSGSIGRRYRRQDEIGTPFCITIDSQTQKDKTVTLRERDSMEQKRVKINNLKEEIINIK